MNVDFDTLIASNPKVDAEKLREIGILVSELRKYPRKFLGNESSLVKTGEARKDVTDRRTVNLGLSNLTSTIG